MNSELIIYTHNWMKFFSCNLMLNSGKKNILTLVLSEKKILNETKKKHILHLQVKWPVPYLVKKLCKNQFQLEN